MQSNNPILRQSFGNRRSQQTFPGNGQAHQGYGQQPGYADPSTWGTGTPGTPGTPTATDEGRMTIDSVVQKSAIALLVVVATAAATWFYIGDVVTDGGISDEAWSRLLMLSGVGGLAAFALSMVNSFKRVVSPALVLAFCVAEGVALGAISKFFDVQFGDGIISQAVLGTFAAFAGTLAAYKFFDIKVGNKFRTFVMAGVFGMIALSVMELGLSFFDAQIGFFGFGGLGLVFAVIGLVLGVFMLIMDFDAIEMGVREGWPERESWRMAFALTVALVWIYTNLLRILAILRGE